MGNVLFNQRAAVRQWEPCCTPLELPIVLLTHPSPFLTYFKHRSPVWTPMRETHSSLRMLCAEGDTASLRHRHAEGLLAPTAQQRGRTAPHKPLLSPKGARWTRRCLQPAAGEDVGRCHSYCSARLWDPLQGDAKPREGNRPQPSERRSPPSTAPRLTDSRHHLAVASPMWRHRLRPAP